jgi:hypothetical protein
MSTGETAAAAEEPLEYRVAPNIVSGLKRFRIDRDRLRVDGEKTATTESVRLDDVALVRLTLFQGLAICEVRTRGGKKVVIPGRHFLGFGRFVDQHREYGAFVRALHERLATASPNARFVAGSNWGVVFAIVLVVMTIAFFVMLLVGVSMGKSVPFARLAPTFFALPIGIGMAWGLFRMGRAKAYDPRDPPARFFGA